MKAYTTLPFLFIATAICAAISFDDTVTVTVTTCPTETAANILASTLSHVFASAPTATSQHSRAAATLGPVTNPLCDPSNLDNIKLKTNLTLLYGSKDPTTPDANAEISLQMKWPSVLLEEISAVKNVVCSDSSVAVTFADVAAYEMSVVKWPPIGKFIFVTNHLGNCDVEFERGLFLVASMTFDKSSLRVIAMAEKSDLQSVAGSMQIDFGQGQHLSPSNSTASFSNSTSTALRRRNIKFDPTYNLNFNTALPANTVLASIQPYVQVTANTASFTSFASFKGHLDYDFWKIKMKELYFDINIGFDANLQLTGDINAAYQGAFAYAPNTLKVATVSIPGILVLGPSLSFAIGVQIVAAADVTVITHTQVTLANGLAHVDLLKEANTATLGWKPTYVAEATVDGDTAIQLNPYVQLGVEFAVDFLGGLLDLSSGVKANATLTNKLTLMAGVGAGASSGGTNVSIPTGAVDGVCQNGFKYKSDFIFSVVGYVTQFYSATIYTVKVPVFDKCWPWA